jgi:hypothetical protein
MASPAIAPEQNHINHINCTLSFLSSLPFFANQPTG